MTHRADELFTGRPARGIVNRFIRELGPINLGGPAVSDGGQRG